MGLSITLEDILTFTSISKIFKEQTQSGLKLDVNNNYDIEGKTTCQCWSGG